MIKLISFDVWNTLLNLHVFYSEVAKEFSFLTENDSASILNIIEDAYDEAKNLRRAGKFSEHNIYEESSKFLALKLNSSTNIVKRAFHRAALTVNVNNLIIEDAMNVLEEIKKLGIKIVTLGNTLFWPSSITRILLERTQLADYIDNEFYSDEIGFFKPKFEAFNTMLTAMNVSASQALHIGDSLHEDFIGSINSGLRGILIDPSVNSIIKISKYGFIIPRLRYILKLIYDKNILT
ncbi:MAG: HAD family hydrolase [Thermoprotei archaeon]